ncbi:MAG TPA: hypothetical protein VNP94_03310 [Actinomycetota bacterium]|nr:hypothetical protein [Actinomycetota bacterium]
MDRELIRDLARWERGELPLDGLRATHGARAGALVELHGRLAALGAGPVPSADAAWAELAPRLPGRGTVRPSPARPLRRALVAAAAALVLALGVAGPRPVRHQLLSFLERVGAALGLEEERPDARTTGLGTVGPGAPTPATGTRAGVPAIGEDGDASQGAAREGDRDGDGGAGGPAEDGEGAALEDEDADAEEPAREEEPDEGTGEEDAGEEDRDGSAPEEEPDGSEDDGSGGGEDPDEGPEEGGEEAGSEG